MQSSLAGKWVLGEFSFEMASAGKGGFVFWRYRGFFDAVNGF